MTPEEALFAEFRPHCPLPIARFERREPPEPDILCRLADGREVAFEITETVDRDLARAQGDDVETSQWLQQQAEGFRGGVLFAINYLDDTSRAARQRKVDALFDELRRIPGEFTGQWEVTDECLRSVVRRIGVSRGSWDTVEFQVPAVASIRDPIHERILAKARKRYETSAPIHLLVYYDRHPCTFDGQLTNETPFERIWVFDRASRKVWSFGG